MGGGVLDGSPAVVEREWQPPVVLVASKIEAEPHTVIHRCCVEFAQPRALVAGGARALRGESLLAWRLGSAALPTVV